MLPAVLLVILIFVCVALVGVILLQRSEGGALGMGGGPSGFMSTRGVGDLLSRTTGILAAIFFVLCLALTVIMGRAHKGESVVDRLKIDALDPASLARKPTTPAPATPATNPNAAAPILPILEAPKPQVHTTPSTAPLSAKPAVAGPITAKPAPITAAPVAPAPEPANTSAPAKS